jgi:hypothetical protein
MFAFFLCWTLSAAEFPLSVGAADFCSNPNEYAAEQLDDPVAAYYIICSPDAVNPFSQDIMDAVSYLYAAQQDILSVEQTTNMTFVRPVWGGWTDGMWFVTLRGFAWLVTVSNGAAPSSDYYTHLCIILRSPI